MPLLPKISLVLAGCLALTNVWLSLRVGRVRGTEKVSVGDGGNERVIRRMRAHANFAENAWVVLALVVLIELATGPSLWLWLAASLFVLARIAHGFGMDGWYPGRVGGTVTTLLLQLVLAVWAIGIVVMAHAPAAAPATEAIPVQG